MSALEFMIQGERGPRLIEDADGLRRALDDLGTEYGNNIGTVIDRARPLLPSGFPDHELHVAVDATRGVGALRFMADGTWFTKGSTPPAGVATAGSARDFPEDSELPLDTVRVALVEFLETHRRPESVDWQDDPHDF